MDNTELKLQKCFLTVFPQLNTETVRDASVESLSAWDSVAHITLLTVVGEEFGTDIDFEEFAGASSFADVLERLRAITS